MARSSLVRISCFCLRLSFELFCGDLRRWPWYQNTSLHGWDDGWIRQGWLEWFKCEKNEGAWHWTVSTKLKCIVLPKIRELSAKAPGEKVWNQTQNRSTLLEEVQWSSFGNGATSKSMTEIEGGYEGLWFCNCAGCCAGLLPAFVWKHIWSRGRWPDPRGYCSDGRRCFNGPCGPRVKWFEWTRKTRTATWIIHRKSTVSKPGQTMPDEHSNFTLNDTTIERTRAHQCWLPHTACTHQDVAV